MNIEQVKEIANAVLYEGYLLYPYRQSALKNQQRWTFGVVYPREYSEAGTGTEPWTMRTECLVQGHPDTAQLDISVRFLHLLTHATASTESWEEGIERELQLAAIPLSTLLEQPITATIALSGELLREVNTNHTINNQTTEQTTIRETHPLEGLVRVAATPTSHTKTFKLSITIENTTPNTGNIHSLHTTILRQSFVSTHSILHVRNGSFISLLEPPAELTEEVQQCHNVRTWPVLVGNNGQHDTMLSSPIILYDYPQIAPESPGALFDGTEIDEILSLRILTLTDEEKQEIRRGDERARALLERTESLSAEQFLKLHGVLRDIQSRQAYSDGEQERMSDTTDINNIWDTGSEFPGEDYPPPSQIAIEGGMVSAGDHVRLQPRARADAFDILLQGKLARVEKIQQDFENRLYLVVTLDDDPGQEQWDERILPGHRFFFFPEEVELITETDRRQP
jgi:hypothetical protein